MEERFIDVGGRVSFDADRAAKVDLVRGSSLFLGLNTFEAGQRQAPHVHRGADKFYLLVSGKARMIVGRETREVGPGMLVWAPADEPHGVVEALERTVMLVGMAPPPRP
ncbi:MAG TPA: cupin domain-containing protein [Gemmatimonadales bacterium]|nr:cupin domain-containing protein [Gemmatimonadales bacterium]